MEEEEKVQQETKEEKPDQAKQKMEEIGKPLEKMTAVELREVAVLIEGITGAHAMKKEELLGAIKEAWGIEEEEPAKAKTKESKAGTSVKDLKAKIALFKEEKAAAREANDRKKVDVLRRRINRLKKQTRKAAQA
ncbi:MAG: transcription termination factor Rho [Desulfobacteraceae bacterium]|jgi:hypothetical protein